MDLAVAAWASSLAGPFRLSPAARAGALVVGAAASGCVVFVFFCSHATPHRDIDQVSVWSSGCIPARGEVKAHLWRRWGHVVLPLQVAARNAEVSRSAVTGACVRELGQNLQPTSRMREGERCAPATESLHEVDLELLAVPNQHALPREATTKVVSQVCARRCLPWCGLPQIARSGR